MTTPATQPSQLPGSIWIRGGAEAPRRARRHARSQLAPRISGLRASDAALIVSELVTNSVVHAGVDIDRSLLLELTIADDRLRIAVTDPGSELEPHMLASDSSDASGFGLRLVDRVSSAWGVARNPAGLTRVWCDVPLDGSAC